MSGSEENIRLQIGKLILEQNDLEKQIGGLRDELSRRARVFAHVGRILVFTPERLFFGEQTVPAEFAGEAAVDRSAIEVDTLVAELRNAITQKNDCVKQLAELGIDAEESERERDQRASRALRHPANVGHGLDEAEKKPRREFGFSPKKNK